MSLIFLRICRLVRILLGCVNDMDELSLFSGVGGGLLASKLLGWRTIGYVEKEAYNQAVIRARIEDGYFDEAPIFGDIKVFNDSGYAAAYTGLVDIITAGFPCTSFSAAGKKEGGDSEDNLWPETIECIRIVRPRFVFLENVPRLVSIGYIGTVLCDLAENGYDAGWRLLSAEELGAPHRRDRWWLVAYSTGWEGYISEEFEGHGVFDIEGNGEEKQMANTDSKRCEELENAEEPNGKKFFDECSDVGDNEKEHVANTNGRRWKELDSSETSIEETVFDGCDYEIGKGGGWWVPEPGIPRVDDGVAFGVDRIEAVGRGQVPAVAASVWQMLMEGIGELYEEDI